MTLRASTTAAAVSLLFAAALLAGCAKRAPTCTYVHEGNGPAGDVDARPERIVAGLEVPWGIAFVTPSVMLVTERKGRLRLVTGDVLVPEPIATIPVHADAESGLLGIALAPSFAATRQFFLYMTVDEGGRVRNRIERWVLAADARSAARDRVLLDDIPASPAHDGGRLRIGPDGMLWAGTGDARDRDRPPDIDSLAGKVLRMTVDGAVPADNPWPGRYGWVKGVRNVQAFDWLDVATGLRAERMNETTRLVVADHGPSGELGRRGEDEVTLAWPTADLGWPDTYSCDAHDSIATPSIAWSKAVPPGGAALYTGTRIPEWHGSLLVTSLGAKHLHRIVFSRSGDPRRIVTHETYFEGDPPRGLGRLRDAIIGPDGELYVTTSNCDGRGTCPPEGDAIFRITR